MRDDTLVWFGGAGALGIVAVMFTDTGQNAVNAVKSTVQGVVSTRTPQDILDAVAIVDPAHNPDLQRGANGGADWCNKFLYLVLTQLGVYMPVNTLANDEIAYMANSSAWMPASQDDAQAAALQGQVAVATYYNAGGHGHVALVLPLDGPMQVAQAGATVSNQLPLQFGFGSVPVQFFVHV